MDSYYVYRAGWDQVNEKTTRIESINFLYKNNDPIVKKSHYEAAFAARHLLSLTGGFNSINWDNVNSVYQNNFINYIVPIKNGEDDSFVAVNRKILYSSRFFNMVYSAKRLAATQASLASPKSAIIDPATNRLMTSLLNTHGKDHCPKCNSLDSSFVRMSLVCNNCKTLIGGI